MWKALTAPRPPATTLLLFCLFALPAHLPAAAPTAAPTAAAAPVVVLLLDTSGSIQPEDIGRVQTLSRNLLAGLPGWEIAVYKFNDESQLLLERTSRIDQIEGVIGALAPEGRYTALYDALFDASQYLERQRSPRRAIVILTDGRNEGGETTLEEGLAVARGQHIPVFAVGIGKRINHRVLQRIADQTGGEYAEIAATTGEALAAAIRRAVGPEPPTQPTAGQTIKAGVPPAPPRPKWPLAVFAVLVVAAGLFALLLWWFLRLRREPAQDPGDHDATVPAQPLDPADYAGAVDARLPPPERTVRIRHRSSALRVRDGDGVGQIYPILPTTATLVGRSPAAEVTIPDQAASYEHCRIMPAGVGYVLIDMNSTNGTTVNGAPVKEHVLREGDVIRIGNTTFEFAYT